MSDLLALDRFYDLQNQILFHSYKNTKILSSEISGEEYCFLLFRQLEKRDLSSHLRVTNYVFFTLKKDCLEDSIMYVSVLFIVR